jgi:hypothetical protein
MWGHRDVSPMRANMADAVSLGPVQTLIMTENNMQRSRTGGGLPKTKGPAGTQQICTHLKTSDTSINSRRLPLPLLFLDVLCFREHSDYFGLCSLVPHAQGANMKQDMSGRIGYTSAQRAVGCGRVGNFSSECARRSSNREGPTVGNLDPNLVNLWPGRPKTINCYTLWANGSSSAPQPLRNHW